MTRDLRTYYCIYVLILGACLNVQGQDLPFKNFTALDGLSSSEVYDLAQDTQGYLWFATDRGLTRYDGTTFERFTTSNGLPNNVVFNFFEQEDGTIWCSTAKKDLFYFKNATDGFHEYRHNDIIKANLNPDFDITNVVISPDNDIYIANNNLGYLKISPSGTSYNTIVKRPASYNFDKLSTLTLKNVPNFRFQAYRDLTEIVDSDLEWDYVIESIIRFSRMLVFPEQDVRIGFMGNTYFIIDANNSITPGIVPYHNKHAIMAGKYDEDTIWVGYQYGGVILMDIHGNIKAHYLKESSVTKVFADHEGGLWMSTLDQGVFYCSQPQIRQYPLESYPVELTKDKTNQLYVALHNGNVLTLSLIHI